MRIIYFFIASFLPWISNLNATLSSKDFHIFTVASKETDGLNRLLASCDHFNVDIDIVGMGLPYKGNGQKLNYLKEYLAEIPDNHIVMFVDGYDTLILADKETILRKFFEKEVVCVFGAEASAESFPFRHLSSRFPRSPTKFQFLNSGTYIAYAGYLKRVLDAINIIKEKSSDQGQIVLYYINHTNEIYLDYFCDLFFPLHRVKGSEVHIDEENKTVRCLLTDTHPCVIHGNCLGRKLYRHIAAKLFNR